MWNEKIFEMLLGFQFPGVKTFSMAKENEKIKFNIGREKTSSAQQQRKLSRRFLFHFSWFVNFLYDFDALKNSRFA